MIEYIIIGLIAIIFFSGIRIVRPVEVGVIETLGKYKGIARQGFKWIIPIIQTMQKVNLTERMLDVAPQDIITKDNLNATVDLVVYYKVKEDDKNILKSIYKVDDFEKQVISLAQTTARNVIGDMKFTDVNNNRNKLNHLLEKVLDEKSDSWGVQIINVEMKEITPPSDVQESMNKVIKAEKQKEAAIDFATAKETEADGEKRSEIKKAEGIKQAAILRAEGEAQAIKSIADARAKEIELVNQSLQKNFKGEAQMYKKLETAESALKKGSKYVIDSKSNITNVMSEVAGITPIK